MKLNKCLKLALNILLHSKLRSWLTIVGIVIGVAAVVAIVSIGQGLQQNVQSRLGGLGADIITISPGGGKAAGGFRGGFGGGEQESAASVKSKNLTKQDIQVIKSVENINLAEGIISGRGVVYYLGQKASASIDGVDPLVWKEITVSELDQGRFIGPTDYNAVVVGSRIAKTTFKQLLALNREITIEGKSFKIAGILKESGGGDDGKIIMPINAARETLTNAGNDNLNSIIVKVTDADLIDETVANIDQKLMLSRHVAEQKKDYSINTAKATQERVASVTQTMTLFLGAIAAVSLIVGAVGIANTMFTSVLEKTKDIGIMKAIGAGNKDIMFIFMFNSGLVGLVGGLLGIGLGSIISGLIPMLGLRLMGGGGPTGGALTTAISPGLLISALFLSIIIGMAAGIIPAYRASKLKPVDALRYE
ncbi:ABC transporter permease [Candidatus Woesearchaeota archaeon]|nr:ABC transporter permease [Candidatus Woesearchaeota archaeon]